MKQFLFAILLFTTRIVCAQSCPTISVSCSNEVTAGEPATFVANVSGGDAQVTPTYNWSISNGSISSGQGTSSITVDTKDLSGTITATVDIGGYARECATSNSCTIMIKAEEKNPFEGATISVSSSLFTAADMKLHIATLIRANDWNTYTKARYALAYIYPATGWKAAQIKKVRTTLESALLQSKVQKGQYKIVTAPASAKAHYTITLVKQGEAEPGPEE